MTHFITAGYPPAQQFPFLPPHPPRHGRRRLISDLPPGAQVTLGRRPSSDLWLHPGRLDGGHRDHCNFNGADGSGIHVLKGGTDVTSAAYTIKGVLDTARTYAKANNTYTWVGFFEEDVSQSSTNPATAELEGLSCRLLRQRMERRFTTQTALQIPTRLTPRS